jgi:hypothetical protein
VILRGLRGIFFATGSQSNTEKTHFLQFSFGRVFSFQSAIFNFAYYIMCFQDCKLKWLFNRFFLDRINGIYRNLLTPKAVGAVSGEEPAQQAVCVSHIRQGVGCGGALFFSTSLSAGGSAAR